MNAGIVCRKFMHVPGRNPEQRYQHYEPLYLMIFHTVADMSLFKNRYIDVM